MTRVHLTGLCVQASQPLATRARPRRGGDLPGALSPDSSRGQRVSVLPALGLRALKWRVGGMSPASLQSGSAVVCQNELGHFSVAGSLTSIFFCVLSIFFCVLNFSIIKVQI